jgi:hypothetical protein
MLPLGSGHSTSGVLLFSVPDDNKELTILLAENRKSIGIEIIPNLKL